MQMWIKTQSEIFFQINNFNKRFYIFPSLIIYNKKVISNYFK
jgi:hypothetical protein